MRIPESLQELMAVADPVIMAVEDGDSTTGLILKLDFPQVKLWRGIINIYPVLGSYTSGAVFCIHLLMSSVVDGQIEGKTFLDPAGDSVLIRNLTHQSTLNVLIYSMRMEYMRTLEVVWPRAIAGSVADMIKLAAAWNAKIPSDRLDFAAARLDMITDMGDDKIDWGGHWTVGWMR